MPPGRALQGASKSCDEEAPSSRTDEFTDSGSDTPISNGEIRSALERLLSDGRLHMSERNRRFLRFVVEEALSGRAARIKSYTIAVDVFGRAPTFDGMTDPIVRIEAVRLRAALADYYSNNDVDDGIRIELPRGGYVPRFHRIGPKAKEAAAAPPPVIATRRFLSPAVLLCGALLCAAAIWTMSSNRNVAIAAPVIAVESVEVADQSPQSQEVALGLTQSIISGLSRFPGLKLVHLREGRASAGAKSVEPTYVLTSSLRTSDGSLRFWWSVLNTRTQETVWSETIDQTIAGEVPLRLEDQIAARVASRIAEPFGVVGTTATGAFASGALGYRCVLQARAQLAAPDAMKHRQIRRCLERTVSLAPEYADAWAVLALIYLYEERPWQIAGSRDPNLPAMALDASQRAVRLAPQSGLAYLALLASRFRVGDFAAADEAAKYALDLNPNDPEILQAVGWRAYIRGRSSEGLAHINRARELAGRTRPSGQFILALDAYRRGDFSRAHEILQAQQKGSLPLLDLLCAASHAKLGEHGKSIEDLEAVLRKQPDYGLQIRSDLALLHFEPELSDLLVEAAQTAGLQVPSPAGGRQAAGH